MRSSRVLALAAAGLMGSAVLMAGAMGAVSASVAGGSGSAEGVGGTGGAGGPGGTGTGTSSAAPSATAVSEIPAGMLTLYRAAAAATCVGLPWAVLAAIGTVESGNGTSDLPGVHAGANGAGAEGPMQFEPRTFAAYATPVPPGGVTPPSPYDPVDAVYAAARMLCANGAAGGADVPAAVFAYNHDDAYVSEVLSLAATFEVAPPAVTTSTVGATAVAWALAQVGTPYIWGGETPGVGFDCSGLVQAAYRAAGFVLPRVAQNQFDATTPALTQGTMLQPGDLVFFGTGPHGVSHVGLYIGVEEGRTMMVDAPHTGAQVRVEAFPVVPGAKWGSDIFVGATRPHS